MSPAVAQQDCVGVLGNNGEGLVQDGAGVEQNSLQSLLLVSHKRKGA